MLKPAAGAGRLHWPRAGVAIRVPPRRLADRAPDCEVIAFAGDQAEAARTIAWSALATAIPRGSRVVLLVAPEDVSFSEAEVPALSGIRLREALPNLVEDATVGDVGSLHVALGQIEPERGGMRILAVIDRHWLAAMQVQVVRAGHRVAVILPESLVVPLVPGSWSLAACGTPSTAVRAWLRYGFQQAIPLPEDASGVAAIAGALVRRAAGEGRPRAMALHGNDGQRAWLAAAGAAAAAALGLPADPELAPRDPFAGWLAGNGPAGGYGAPLSLLAFDGGERSPGWARWRIAALLAVAVVAVQLVGMQWQWATMRREAAALREDSTRLLIAAFPETRAVLDAPLQMSRGLATLRASAGRSDPADFSMMMAASARVFAALPSNAFRAVDYDARALRIRFAPGMATAADERERLVAAALQEGYVLRFEASPSAAGESVASLKLKSGA